MASDKRGGAIAVSIPEHLFSSPPYRALTPLERCLLTELLAVAKRVGTDVPINGSVRMAADMCGVGKSHAAEAMSSLEAKGFIVRVRRGEKRGRRGFASAWRITCLPFQGEWPTCDYNRIHDRKHDRKLAEDRAGAEKFMTPELEALWVRTEASFAKKTIHFDDEEHDESMGKLDAVNAPRGRARVSGGADTSGQAGVRRAGHSTFIMSHKFTQ
jgi:hypothetical protein